MDFCVEYYRIESAVKKAAEHLGLIDERYIELLRSKLIQRPEFDEQFREWFSNYMRDKPIDIEVDGRPVRLKLDAVNLTQLIDHIRDQYFYAICQKLALGERFAEKNPGVSAHDNLGYDIGSSLVDVITHDAMSWLSKQYIFVGERPRDIDDVLALKIMGRIIPAVLGAMMSTEKFAESPQWVEAQNIFVIDPQPRLLPRGTDLIPLIDKQPIEGAKAWVNKMIQRDEAAKSGTRDLS